MASYSSPPPQHSPSRGSSPISPSLHQPSSTSTHTFAHPPVPEVAVAASSAKPSKSKKRKSTASAAVKRARSDSPMDLDDEIEGLLGDGPPASTSASTSTWDQTSGPDTSQLTPASATALATSTGKPVVVPGEGTYYPPGLRGVVFKPERQDGEYPVTCRWVDCGLVLPNQTALVEHMKYTHVVTAKDPIRCGWEGCPRGKLTETSRHALSAHMRTHTREKLHTCSYADCSKSFARSDTLSKHIKTQHVDSAFTSTPQVPGQQPGSVLAHASLSPGTTRHTGGAVGAGGSEWGAPSARGREQSLSHGRSRERGEDMVHHSSPVPPSVAGSSSTPKHVKKTQISSTSRTQSQSQSKPRSKSKSKSKSTGSSAIARNTPANDIDNENDNDNADPNMSTVETMTTEQVIEDLLLDDDLAEVLPKVRKRDILVPMGEEEDALEAIRAAYPRARGLSGLTNPSIPGSGSAGKSQTHSNVKSKSKSKSKPSSKVKAESPDELDTLTTLDSNIKSYSNSNPNLALKLEADGLDDPPPELSIPDEAQLIQTIPDPDIPGGEIDILGRSEWQARYVMIKARLMLVEEENTMRRIELRELLMSSTSEGRA